MNTALVLVDPLWTQRYYRLLLEHYELVPISDLWPIPREYLSAESIEAVEFAYSAAAMYVFWRTRTDKRSSDITDRRVGENNQNLQRIIADIIYGGQLFEHDPMVLVQHWEQLYYGVHASLLEIQRFSEIRNVRFEVDQLPPRSMLVNCVFQ